MIFTYSRTTNTGNLRKGRKVFPPATQITLTRIDFDRDRFYIVPLLVKSANHLIMVQIKKLTPCSPNRLQRLQS